MLKSKRKLSEFDEILVESSPMKYIIISKILLPGDPQKSTPFLDVNKLGLYWAKLRSNWNWNWISYIKLRNKGCYWLM